MSTTKNKNKKRWDPVGRSYGPRVRAPLPPPGRMRENLPPLNVTAELAGKNILIVGGTDVRRLSAN